MPRKTLPFLIAAVIVGGLLLFFAYCAPLEPASVTVYAGIVIAATGALCLLKPLRFFGIRRRRAGLVLIAAGIAVTMVGFSWPAGRIRIASRVARLDDFMPEYEFSEVHDVRVHASPDRAAAAIQATTFDDIGVFETLMRLRMMASGHFLARRGAGLAKPVMEAFKRPGSGFIPLSEDSRETVMGMAGAPWASGPPPKLLNAADYAAFHAPGSVKIAFNMRVEDAGSGWSRVLTETRVHALDDASRRTMARYWRAIYPGSGLIRRCWLSAIRDRAERPAPAAG
jgi:hypothetical protein